MRLSLYSLYNMFLHTFLCFKLKNNCISMFCNLCLPSMILLFYLEALLRCLALRPRSGVLLEGLAWGTCLESKAIVTKGLC